MADQRATEAVLDGLHSLVANTFVEEIRRAKESDEGIPASLLAQAAKFLKDNGVDRAIRAGDPLDTLLDELPELEDFNHG